VVVLEEGEIEVEREVIMKRKIENNMKECLREINILDS